MANLILSPIFNEPLSSTRAISRMPIASRVDWAVACVLFYCSAWITIFWCFCPLPEPRFYWHTARGRIALDLLRPAQGHRIFSGSPRLRSGLDPSILLVSIEPL